MERQAVLERLDWTFVRIRSSDFFREPDRAMQPVFSRLEALGITPDGGVPEVLEREPGDLVETVIRRAEEIRREWESTPQWQVDDEIQQRRRFPDSRGELNRLKSQSLRQGSRGARQSR